jgi:flagellar basal-body rod modification protein FlgD
MPISPTGSTTASGNVYTAQTTAQTSSLPEQTLNQDDFLKLLVAQMSAQDPMNPISNTEFISQMAQFSTLQQTKSMQSDLAGLQAGQTALQANGLLGRTVQVRTAQGLVDSGLVSAVDFQAGTPSLIVNGQSYYSEWKAVSVK